MNSSALPSLVLNPGPSKARRPRALFILDPDLLEQIYGTADRCALMQLADIQAPVHSKESIRANLSLMGDVEVIFSGWDAPVMDEEFLEAAPKLKAIFYAAGSIRSFTTPAFWRRNIAITCAAEANAIPVAEFTQAAIVLSLKRFWSMAAQAKLNQGWLSQGTAREVAGCYQSTVGFVSLGRIARKTLELLNSFDLYRLVYSVPTPTDAEASRLRFDRCGLDDLFKRADVVSLHAPDLPATNGMITGRHFELMKPGATFINTARGTVVREKEMIEVLRRRPDLTVVLDVTDPEPPASDSPLLQLPNVVLTPHIAGSMGLECQRLGNTMLQEFQRYLAGKPLQWQVTEEVAATMA